jgi:hypothetical protein
MNRTEQLEGLIDTLSDPDDFMTAILEVFTESDYIPEPGNYYTFVYLAKTPKIIYDQHPLIACTGVYQWGFTGLNFHLNSSRRYTWQEVIGQVHKIYNDEITYMRSIPYQKTILNS